MRRFFVKNLLFVILVNLLVKPIWVLVIDRTVQNRVGHADYGTYQALLNLSIIFNILLDFGLTYYNTRIVSGQPTKIRTLFPAMLSARLVLILTYSAIVCITGLAIGYGRTEMLLLLGVLTIQSLNSLMLFLRSNVSALHKFKIDAILSVIDRLLVIIICSIFLFSGYITDLVFRIEWFIIIQIISYIVAIVVAFIALQKLTGSALRFSFNMEEVTAIIKKSLPYASLVFLMAVHMRLDTVLIERLCGEESKVQAGIYAAAYRLLDVGNMFGIMFAGMLLPMFGRMLTKKSDIQPIIKLSVNLLIPVAFIASGAAVFYGDDIMNLLYVHTDESSGLVFAWLMSCFPAYCIMYIYSTLLTANGNLILLNKIAIVGVIINLTLNLYLIPRQFAVGAAVTAFITQSTMALCFIFFSGRTLQLPRNIKWIGAHLIFVILVFFAGYISTMIDTGWLNRLLLYGGLSLSMIFLFRFVSIRSIAELMNKK